MTINLTEPRSVVLTTDGGTEMDDQRVIVHLALCPEIDLLGIVSNHAPNVTPPAATTLAAAVTEVLDTLKLDHHPLVVTGSDDPLRDSSTPNCNPSGDLILEQARGHCSDDRLIVLSIGAATDVASALLVEPDLAGLGRGCCLPSPGNDDHNDLSSSEVERRHVVQSRPDRESASRCALNHMDRGSSSSFLNATRSNGKERLCPFVRLLTPISELTLTTV